MPKTKLPLYEECMYNSSAVACSFFENWHFVLPADGTHEPKHVLETNLMLVLIKNVHLVGK
jgi:hypothetical protein